MSVSAIKDKYLKKNAVYIFEKSIYLKITLYII